MSGFSVHMGIQGHLFGVSLGIGEYPYHEKFHYSRHYRISGPLQDQSQRYQRSTQISSAHLDGLHSSVTVKRRNKEAAMFSQQVHLRVDEGKEESVRQILGAFSIVKGSRTAGPGKLLVEVHPTGPDAAVLARSIFRTLKHVRTCVALA